MSKTTIAEQDMREPEEIPDDIDWDAERELLDARVFGVFIPTADPETLPDHNYATEREYREHLDEVWPLAG